MNSLRYPKEVGGNAAPDYVEFVPSRYRSNIDQRRGPGGAAPPTQVGAQSVILYMPNNTPGVGNPQMWGDVNFIGPIGEAKRDIGTGAAKTVYAGGTQATIDEFVNQLTRLRDGAGDATGPGILKQGALNARSCRV